MFLAAWARDLKSKEWQQAMSLGSTAQQLLDQSPELSQVAVDETSPYVLLLLERLTKAPDPIGIAAGKNMLFEAVIGWTIAQLEIRESKWHRKGQTHPIVNNGIISYIASAKNEYTDSLALAVETGYYVARIKSDGNPEGPEAALSELY
jgi:hypothetical protein